jgi:hypothetical protein
MPKFVSWVFLLVLFAAAPSRAETVWFEVAEIADDGDERDEAFLLPLSDPAHIAQARSLIAQGPGGSVGSIVSARIALGPDGLNRDTRAPGEPLWSWYVSEFLGFADSAIELCDGWPGFIQQDVAAFIANTNGQICFWGYTVKRELNAAPRFRINEALDGAWYHPQHDGQGLFLDVMAERNQIFLGWFTFAQAGTASIGDPAHRWLTAQGPFSEDQADLTLVLTTGGAFASAQPVRHDAAGTLRLSFTDCNHGHAHWQFSDGSTGDVAIERIAPQAR